MQVIGRILIVVAYMFFSAFLNFTSAQQLSTPFEKSAGRETATYFECLDFYKSLDSTYKQVLILGGDTTDAGYPLHLVLYTADGNFSPSSWINNKVVIMINNGIHPGEPDGIDASMMLLRDAASGKIKVPANILLAVIPIYNIGGSLNRNSFSRANQNGPLSYGFRGNAQNLDLNRDFIKADTKNAFAFEKFFQYLHPHILIDNHVSDGADYQHTMTLLTTQHNKLGGETGAFLNNVFEPELFKQMSQKKWDMTPYVNFEDARPEEGWIAFYDPPRYSSGYAALFATMAFVPETHMLKPYKERVNSTYALMQTIITAASRYAGEIISNKEKTVKDFMADKEVTLTWTADTVHFNLIDFKGYEAATKKSDVTGMDRLYYDHTKPFNKKVKFFNNYNATLQIVKPKAYIIPQGWSDALERLKLNGVEMAQLKHDTLLHVEYYHIDAYKSYPKPYEKHHRNYDAQVSTNNDDVLFLKGDYIIYTGQTNDRYLIETLEPLADDSYFSWNFFDAVLQQKEGYSDYRWEDLAEDFLNQNPLVKKQLEEKKLSDSVFASSAKAQLEFVYKHSPYYEPAHLRYPVYRLMK